MPTAPPARATRRLLLLNLGPEEFEQFVGQMLDGGYV